MKRFASIQYQLDGWIKPLVMYYLFMAAYLVISVLSFVRYPAYPGISGLGISSIYYNYWGFDTMVVLFAIGFFSFKSTFDMLIQNGYSRRKIFTGGMLAFLGISTVTTIFDTIIGQFLNRWEVMGNAINYYGAFDYYFTHSGNDLLTVLLPVCILNICVYMAVLSSSWFFAAAAYRLDKNVRLLFFIVMPFLLLLMLMIQERIFTQVSIANLFSSGLGYVFGWSNGANPMIGVAVSLIILAGVSTFTLLVHLRITPQPE